MTGVQFFKKTNDNIEGYKKLFLEWLNLALENELLEENIFDILKRHILSQDNYIQREDTKNYLVNIKLIIKEKKLKQTYIRRINSLKLDSDLQYWYEKISIANDICVERKEQQQKIQERKDFELIQKIQREKEEKEKKKELENLENLFEQL